MRETSARPELDGFVSVLHAELSRMARRQMTAEGSDTTLDAGALVNEAYLRLARQRGRWQNGAHVLGVAACCMRRIRIDHARRRGALKRPDAPVGLDQVRARSGPGIEEPVAVREALDWLAALDRRQARVVRLRFFAGFTVCEIAERIGASPATVKRELGAGLRALETRLRAGATLAPPRLAGGLHGGS